MATKIKLVDCSACNGSGKMPAPEANTQLRAARERAGISMRALAEAMGKSHGYIGDVERGHRTLTATLASLYLSKLEELKDGGE